MDIFVTKNYLFMIFILWIAPIVSAIWGAPVWITISLAGFFLIYAGHEWIHALACKKRGLTVISMCFATGNRSETVFEKPENPVIEGDIYLAGVAYDLVILTVISLNSMFYAMWFKQEVPFIFALSIILIALFVLSAPQSDWKNFIACKRQAELLKKGEKS